MRPGEKLHEIMVSEEEANHCVKRGNYYAIQPMLPELAVRTADKRGVLSGEFSSADNVLDLKETEALLRRHRLMPEDVQRAALSELLR